MGARGALPLSEPDFGPRRGCDPSTVPPARGGAAAPAPGLCEANKGFNASTVPVPPEGPLLPPPPGTAPPGNSPTGPKRGAVRGTSRTPAVEPAPCSREPPLPSQDAVLFTGAATTHERDTQTSQRLSCPYGMENVPKTQVPAWGGLGWPRGLPGGGHGPGRGSQDTSKPPLQPLDPKLRHFCSWRGSGRVPLPAPSLCPPQAVQGGPRVVPHVSGCLDPCPRSTQRPAWHVPGAGPPPQSCARSHCRARWGGSGGVTSELGPPAVWGAQGTVGTPPHPTTALAFSSRFRTIVNPESRAPKFARPP